MKKLTVGSLFSGIGGLELGLERTGRFKTIWQCEIEPYPSAVLRKNFPKVPNIGDITKVDWSHVERPDLLCGGFPCQDISIAGKRKGIKNGKRSGLWKEFSKAIGVLRPKYVLIENVPNLANLGLDIVLADLAQAGYDAEWCCLSAAEVGACHKRERLFVFANLECDRIGHGKNPSAERHIHISSKDANLDTNQQEGKSGKRYPDKKITTTHANDGCQPTNEICARGPKPGRGIGPPNVAGWPGPIQRFPEFSWCQDVRRIEDLRNRPDIPEPLICRESHGLSRLLDNYTENERIKALGNAVVPQVAETIGNWILGFLDVPEK